MFIEPATSISPRIGRSRSAATAERAPSAPTRYLLRIPYVVPVSRSRTVVVTPSASWTWETYSVENRLCVPRTVALRTRIGSRYVCGMSQLRLGEASR